MNRKNRFEHTGAAKDFGTVYLVVDQNGGYRTTTNIKSVQPNECPIAKATCWANDAHSAYEAGRTLLDQAGVVDGQKRY